MRKNLIYVILIILVVACNNKTPDIGEYEVQKKSLADVEKENPLQFIVIEGEWKRHLLGRTVVRGVLINKATLCSFKNLRLQQIAFANGKQVEEHEDVIDDVIKPGENVPFKTRYKLPKGADSVALFVMSAETEKCN
jgi:hypothetical protein